jgi:hypothetical protein
MGGICFTEETRLVGKVRGRWVVKVTTLSEVHSVSVLLFDQPRPSQGGRVFYGAVWKRGPSRSGKRPPEMPLRPCRYTGGKAVRDP